MSAIVSIYESVLLYSGHRLGPVDTEYRRGFEIQTVVGDPLWEGPGAFSLEKKLKIALIAVINGVTCKRD